LRCAELRHRHCRRLRVALAAIHSQATQANLHRVIKRLAHTRRRLQPVPCSEPNDRARESGAANLATRVVRLAETIHREDQLACLAMQGMGHGPGQSGTHPHLLQHRSLATGGIGTALGVIKRGHTLAKSAKCSRARRAGRARREADCLGMCPGRNSRHPDLRQHGCRPHAGGRVDRCWLAPTASRATGILQTKLERCRCQAGARVQDTFSRGGSTSTFDLSLKSERDPDRRAESTRGHSHHSRFAADAGYRCGIRL